MKALLVAALAIVSTASILTGLRHAFGRRDRRDEPADPREAERARIREALGDLLAPPLDLSKWPEHLRPGPDTPDRDTLRERMKRFDRPIWMDIREDRDSRG